MFISKNKVVGIIAILMLFSMVGVASAGVFDFMFPPSQANADDEIFVAIGGDEFLNATLKGCAKVSEEDIPDESYQSSDGEIGWYGAKNISYVDTSGNKGYMIVWKASPDKYHFNTSKNENLYMSNYLLDRNAISFVEYSYEYKAVYGIVLGTDEISYTEPDLMYDILGLNQAGFDLVYTDTGTSNSAPASSSSSSSSGGDHYHTVVQDRYSLSRSDPDSYYDYYEYGDNYAVDDYLEAEGYD